MTVHRRSVIQAAAAGLVTVPMALTANPAQAAAPGLAPALASRKSPGRARVIVSNDLAGDVDGLFSTVHALLAKSTDVRGIIGTFSGAEQTSRDATKIAKTILHLMGLTRSVPVYLGAASKLASATTPIPSAGAKAIVAEAMRTDTKVPLYVTVGAALTEVASALLLEPSIASKMTVVWIGGGPYPGGSTSETNFGEDPIAAQIVFNNSDVALWQVPSDAYSQCLVSDAELELNVGRHGAIGKWLYKQLSASRKELADAFGVNTGETWVLGDSPLVLLTALTSWVPTAYPDFKYEGTPSSEFDTVNAPHLNSDGTYTARTDGRKIRVYKTIDTRTLFGDFFSRMKLTY